MHIPVTFADPVIFDTAVEEGFLFSKQAIGVVLGFIKLLLGLRSTNVLFGLLIVLINGLPNLRYFSKAADVVIRLCFGVEFSQNLR